MTVRVLIADDHDLMRAGLNALLSKSSELAVVGEAGDGDEAMRLAKKLLPDVVLLDISMPGSGGIQTAKDLRESLPDMKVIILTVHEDEALLRAALRAGAMGYVTKRAMSSELVNAILAVSRGYAYVHPSMTHALITGLQPAPVSRPPSIESLTPRETEVLRLVALGHTNREIAESLSISLRTVERHRSNLMDKLGLHNRPELVLYAKENYLLG